MNIGTHFRMKKDIETLSFETKGETSNRHLSKSRTVKELKSREKLGDLTKKKWGISKILSCLQAFNPH